MEDVFYYNELYDLYGSLLTDKQKKYFEDYYFNNLSFSEMADAYDVSRNAAFKQTHIVTDKLEEYENIADGEYYYDYNKYACDGESATCNNLKYIILKNESEYYYWETDKKYKYSENMNYSNGTYTLTGDIKTIWNWSLENVQTISPYRYSCLSNEITCSKVNYIY